MGASAEKEHGEAIRTAYKPVILERFASQKVAPLPGAREIIAAAQNRGLKVAIATSGEQDFLEAIEKSCLKKDENE